MISDADFLAWLKTDGRRVALVEVDTAVPKYLSTFTYTSRPTDAIPNRLYRAVVEAGVAFTEDLDLTGASASIGSGDIEINNADGKFDAWLDELWVNKSVRVYIGDIRWSRDDFYLVFQGVVSNLACRARDKLNITLRNKLDQINTTVSEAVLGGTSTNKGQLLPLAFGEVVNVTPLMVDPANLVYQVHNGAIERLIEVRDNGVPITSYNQDLANGKFTLTKSPAGAITASVQGAAPYVNTVGAIVRKLATEYGRADTRFTSADVDDTNLNAFNAANPQPVGYYCPDRANVLQSCQELAYSVGGQVVVSRLGKLQIKKVALPASGTPTIIREQDYVVGSLTLDSRTDVIAGVRLGYAKNWTVQSSLDTGIPAAHKTLFAREYFEASSKDTSVADTYKLFAEPELEGSYLLTEADATAECTRRLNLWKVPRSMFSVTCFAQTLVVQLGDPVTLYGSRYGLQAGKTGVVTSVKSDWIKGRVTLGILI